MEKLLHLLDDDSQKKRKKALSDLISSYKRELALPHLSLVSSKLTGLLANQPPQILSGALDFFTLILPDLAQEPSLVHCTFPLLIPLCHHASKKISTSAKKLLKTYQTTTKDTESIIASLVASGLRAPEPRARKQALSLISHFTRIDPSLSVPAARKLLENVIFLLNDREPSVKRVASKCLEQLKRQLSNFQSALGSVTPIYSSVYSGELLSRRTEKPAGFIPEQVYSSLHSEDWRVKLEGLHTVLSLFNSLDNYNELSVHKAEFFSLLSSLLEDSNSRISSLALDLLSNALSVPELADPTLIEGLLPLCISKLGAVQVSIRQAIFSLFKSFCRIVPAEVIFSKLTDCLCSAK